jgi:hypothetical protein
MVDGKYALAQYGQWDGYPEGQGATALEFCRKTQDSFGWVHFREQLKRVRFVESDELRKMYDSVGADGSGWVGMDVSAKFDAKWPYFSRDHGAKILEMVNNANGEVLTSYDLNFAGDSLMCEWVCVVDLDKGVLEFYEGFNHKPLDDNARFASLPCSDNKHCSDKYYQCALVVSWPLYALPLKKDFLAFFKAREEEKERAEAETAKLLKYIDETAAKPETTP